MRTIQVRAFPVLSILYSFLVIRFIGNHVPIHDHAILVLLDALWFFFTRIPLIKRLLVVGPRLQELT